MSKKYSLALLSNDVSEWSAYLRNKFSLDFFDTITISGDVHCRKPTPAIYECFLKDSGAKSEECVFIDDRCKNLAAANSIGMHTIQFLRQTEKADFTPERSIINFIELEDTMKIIANKSFHTDAHSSGR